MGAAYLDVEIDGNTALVWDHVRGCELYFFFFFFGFRLFSVDFRSLASYYYFRCYLSTQSHNKV